MFFQFYFILPSVPQIFQDVGETALHLAVLREMGSSLHIVDFLVQNMPSGGIDRTTVDGETALHLCARHDRAEAMKLLLRAGADPSHRNKQDKTPLDIAQEMGHHTCKELVRFDKWYRKCIFRDNVALGVIMVFILKNQSENKNQSFSVEPRSAETKDIVRQCKH